LCLLLVDFSYYWSHRLSHKIDYLWAFHQVHHYSEQYNCATVMQRSIMELLQFCKCIFYSPLAIFIHPYYIIKTREFIYLYQLFIHTEVIKKVGSFEGIFNTPNYQRIHHSFNRAYLDKNYGGIFILWDRMFGTFKEKGSGPIDYSIPESPQCYGILYQQVRIIISPAITYTIQGVSEKGGKNKL
ncbi:Alkylglycerol monooxygenase, partial [Ooceraea biroi]